MNESGLLPYRLISLFRDDENTSLYLENIETKTSTIQDILKLKYMPEIS